MTLTRLGEWVAGYLDDRGISRSHLIGHSLGGDILLAFAVQHPHRVDKQGHGARRMLDFGRMGRETAIAGIVRLLYNDAEGRNGAY